jgi:GntR family transcriptional regulator
VVEKVEPFVTRRSGAPEGGETADYRGQDRKVKDTTPRVEIHLGSAAPELGRDQTAETVISRHQDRQIDGQPYSMETSFYPKEYADEAADLGKVGDIKEGTVVYLRNALGIKQAGYRDKIIVRPPDPQEATFFRLPAAGQIQMLETRRVAFDEGGEPIRVTVTVYPADRNQLVYEVGAVPPEPSASASNPAADEASLERSG